MAAQSELKHAALYLSRAGQHRRASPATGKPHRPAMRTKLEDKQAYIQINRRHRLQNCRAALTQADSPSGARVQVLGKCSARKDLRLAPKAAGVLVLLVLGVMLTAPHLPAPHLPVQKKPRVTGCTLGTIVGPNKILPHS